jgi:hypothetical protein
MYKQKSQRYKDNGKWKTSEAGKPMKDKQRALFVYFALDK